MKASQLPSGSWRCVVFLGKDKTGKKITHSITTNSKQSAEKLAYEYKERMKKL